MALRSRRLEPTLTSTEEKTLFAEASAARETYNASRAEVIKLAADPKTRAQALELYNSVTADLMEPYIEALQKLTAMQQGPSRRPARKAPRPTATRAKSFSPSSAAR